MSLPDALERALAQEPGVASQADAIRDANGDPVLLLQALDADAARSVLAWLLEHESEAGAELAEAWAELEDGLGPLQAIEPSELPKPGRKALRRALHRLRSRGVELAAPRRSEPAVSKLPDIEDDLGGAFVSPVDPSGARLAYLIEPNPTGGARVVEAVLDEVRGVVEFNVYNAGRSRVREFARGLERRGRSIEVQPEELRALIARIEARHPDDRPVPRALSESRGALRLDAAIDAATPGDTARAALGDPARDAADEALAAAVRLVEERRIGPWPPERERLQKFADSVADDLEGSIIVSGATERERDDETLSAAAGDLFDDEFASATVSRLRESAHASWKDDDEEAARACLAAACAFEQRAPGENPVAVAFVRALVEPFLEQRRQSKLEQEADSLLVKPGEGGG